MNVNWKVLLKDMQDLKAIAGSAKAWHATVTSAEELESFWMAYGKCLLCEANILMKIKAIIDSGSITGCSLHDQHCPECEKRVSASHFKYEGLDSHVS